MASMKTEDLIRSLHMFGLTGIKVKALDPQGRTYTVNEVRTEFAGGDPTVWLKVEEDDD